MARTKAPRASPDEAAPDRGETLYVRGLPPGTLASLDAWADELTAEAGAALKASGLQARATVSRGDLVSRIVLEALAARKPVS